MLATYSTPSARMVSTMKSEPLRPICSTSACAAGGLVSAAATCALGGCTPAALGALDAARAGIASALAAPATAAPAKKPRRLTPSRADLRTIRPSVLTRDARLAHSLSDIPNRHARARREHPRLRSVTGAAGQSASSPGRGAAPKAWILAPRREDDGAGGAPAARTVNYFLRGSRGRRRCRRV